MRLHRVCRTNRVLWFVWDPAGIVIALFAWLLLFGFFVAVLMSISQWVGLLSPVGVTECIWFTGLFETDKEEEAKDDDELEEVEEEMPLNEFEECEDDGSLLIYCDECEIYRPFRAVHCHVCKRCVVLQDHHCPWVNNCVGIGNQKAFLLLLLYVTTTSVQAMLLVLMQYATCSRGKYTCGFQSEQFPGKLGGWILAASTVFGLFCSLMLVMELFNIYQDPLYALIADQLEARRGGDKSESMLERHLSVICGTDGMRASWYFPPPERRSLRDVEIVQGFSCRPEDNEIC
ncbi:unnamed protein product [Peronospora belbahrii]|uniref:Palmitoyltransferase n=1 Tax=Peronospora belbahrii TaxID=622444 RepID=A0ABN8CVG5_9STRA|nr:unnamed protein product [Peronospora belbahrii]